LLQIRLGDFGIAKVLDSTKDFANTCIGTPYYMSPELFKNAKYSYKSDVWALGCVLYEMCNLRHAFDAQSINGLAVKILKGNYPPINSMYSKGLRDLISKMLSVKPQERPTILQVLNKMIVRKRLTHYFNECLKEAPAELAPTDVDDMFVDSLQEQAQNLNIPGYTEDSSVAGRLSSGHMSKPIAGSVNPKKIR
jgi:serine/threonine protein kinase